MAPPATLIMPVMMAAVVTCLIVAVDEAGATDQVAARSTLQVTWSVIHRFHRKPFRGEQGVHQRELVAGLVVGVGVEHHAYPAGGRAQPLQPGGV